MTVEDYAFYEDQREPSVAKSLDADLPLTSPDQMLILESIGVGSGGSGGHWPPCL